MVDLYTFQPDLGSDAGAEPSVYEIVRRYYAEHYSADVAINYAAEYIEQLNKEFEQ